MFSQERMAKKKPRMARSAVIASMESGPIRWARSCMMRRSLGVMAFCRFGGGSTLSYAFKSDLIEGIKRLEFGW